jgi:hypothetical protein
VVWGSRPQYKLLVFIDDATGRLMHLQFVESESTFAYFHAARAYLEDFVRCYPLALAQDQPGGRFSPCRLMRSERPTGVNSLSLPIFWRATPDFSSSAAIWWRTALGKSKLRLPTTRGPAGPARPQLIGSQLHLFWDAECVLDLDPEITDGAFELIARGQ